MAKKSISEFEDDIVKAKDLFFEQFKLMLNLIKQKDSSADQIQDRLTTLHYSGVKFFNLFSRSITEYGLEGLKINENVKNSKIDDAINVSNTIIKYWKLLHELKFQYPIRIPEPSPKSYSTIQLFINTYDSKSAKILKGQFEELGLPIDGFKSNKLFIDMTKKEQVKFGAITGLILLLILLAITFFKDCPTKFQATIFRTILALAASAFATVIPGLININYRKFITASGALAVFVIVFFMKPADISDFKGCTKQFEGTVYFDNKPREAIQVILPKESKSTRTDNFGNFKVKLDGTLIDQSITVQLKNEKLGLDSIFSYTFPKNEESLDIYISTFCTICTQKDSSNVIVNNKRYCSANKRSIEGFKAGFTQKGIELGRIVECIDQ